MNTNDATMTEPTRNDICDALDTHIACDQLYIGGATSVAPQLMPPDTTSALLDSFRKYEREDGVVDWDALRGALQLSCLTY